MNSKIESLKKYKIGVLFGGSSSEREISLKSGKAVFKALTDVGLKVSFLDVVEKNFSNQIDKEKIDIAFIALHGRFGEDGSAQSILEEKNILYTGSSPVSSRIAMDKISSKEYFRREGLNVPKDFIMDKGMSVHPDVFEKSIMGFPCVFKPRYEGSSIGLSIVSSIDKVEEAVSKSFRFGDKTIIEEFIQGREMTVGILNDEALPVVEIVTKEGVYDFEAKYASKETEYISPAKIDQELNLRLQAVAVKAHKALGCRGFSRVDLRVTDDGEGYVLEVNTIPGLTERSLLPMAALAAGIGFSDLCVEMLDYVIEK